MAKVCALASSVILAVHAARITKLAEEEVVSNHCANFNGYNYAKCSVLEEDTRLLDAVCRSPLVKSSLVDGLMHDKCIKCTENQLVHYCKDKVEECSSEELGDKEELICKMIVFGRSEKEGEVTAEGLGDFMRSQKIACSHEGVSLHCAKHEWATCESLTLDDQKKDHICGLVRRDSAARAAQGIGARWGIKCSNAEVRAKCGKEACASYDDDEWEDFCEGKAKAGLLAEEAVEAFAKDGLTCSKDEIKDKCPLPCPIKDEATERTACFGYSSKGRKLQASSPAQVLKAVGLSRNCDVNELKVHCFEKEWPKCNTIPTDVQEKIKENLCPGRGSELADELGGRLGVKCSEEEVASLCGE